MCMCRYLCEMMCGMVRRESKNRTDHKPTDNMEVSEDSNNRNHFPQGSDVTQFAKPPAYNVF